MCFYNKLKNVSQINLIFICYFLIKKLKLKLKVNLYKSSQFQYFQIMSRAINDSLIYSCYQFIYIFYILFVKMFIFR